MALAIESLAVSRGTRRVLNGACLTVQPGEALALLGRNGAGKTTLLRTVAGFLRPDEGRITLGEHPQAKQSEDASPIAERCHYVGHLDGLKGAMTVRENAEFWSRYLGAGAVTVEEALQRVGLAALLHVPARFLSAGQRRRLSLSRLLVTPRPLWLLDEPTTSLDAAGLTMLGSIGDAHLAHGGMIVAATHVDLPFASVRTLRLDQAGPVAA